MALTKEYPAEFERLWDAYPKWPAGRSKKEASYKAFEKARKALKFAGEDIDAIEADIRRRVQDCETWQKGNKFGPVMFATYFNNYLWNEPYPKAKKHWTQRPREEAPEPQGEVRRMDPAKVRELLQSTGLVRH